MALLTTKYKLPKFLCKITQRYEILKIIWPIIIQKSKKLPQYTVKVKDKSFFRYKEKTTIKCWTYVKINNGEDIQNVIQNNYKKIMKKSDRQVRKSMAITDICRYLPIGYLLIYVYLEDFRIRDYSGHKSNMSICTIELNKSKGTKGITLKNSEILGKANVFWKNIIIKSQ